MANDEPVQQVFGFISPALEPGDGRSAGERDRDEGRGKAAAKRPELLAEARRRVIEMARLRESRTATADDVHKLMVGSRWGEAELSGVMGSVFSDGNWDDTGERVRSSRRKRKAGEVRVWKLKEP